jgi:hypothetical protein
MPELEPGKATLCRFVGVLADGSVLECHRPAPWLWTPPEASQALPLCRRHLIELDADLPGGAIALAAR